MLALRLSLSMSLICAWGTPTRLASSFCDMPLAVLMVFMLCQIINAVSILKPSFNYFSEAYVLVVCLVATVVLTGTTATKPLKVIDVSFFVLYLEKVKSSFSFFGKFIFCTKFRSLLYE